MPNKVKAKKGRGPNPLRMDPTRTASLRRAFERQITLRFEKLKAKLRALLLDEDALGLDVEKRDTYFSHPVLGRNSLSVNCGGPGSGVPGPCPSVKAALKGFDEQMKASRERVKAGTLHPKVAEGNVELAKDDLRTIVGSRVETALLKVRRALRGSGKGQEFKAVREAVETSLEEFNVALRARVADVGGETSKEDRYWNRKEVLSKLKKVGENLAWARRRAGLTTNERDDWIEQMTLNCGGGGIVSNAFCPTGPGGGQDNSCSPGGGNKESEAVPDSLRYIGQTKIRLYRASDSEDINSDSTSFSEGQEDAERYLNNPGFGGSNLYSVKVSINPSTVLDLTGEADQTDAISRFLGVKNPGAIGADEYAPRVADKLLEKGVYWIRVQESFPEGSITWIHLSGGADDPELKQVNNIQTEISNSLTFNASRWQFATDPQKVKEFKVWLRSQLREELTGRSEKELWEAYTRLGLQKGAGRAFDDTRRPQKVAADLAGKSDFYLGTRDEFLRSSFNKPVAVEKVQLLAERAFDELENVTSGMATRMTRTLTDGLVKGDGPRDIARELDRDLDIGRNRSLAIARTEIVRAHAEGQLMALEELGVEEVGVAVEWSTAGDEHVCLLCQPLEGVVLKIDEAKGMLPRHPNAVFAGSTFIPYGECLEIVRANYSGPGVVLLATGARKYRTTIGPNHPMLSREGLVRAADLREGDEILYDLRHDWKLRDSPSLARDFKQVPLVENVFESCVSIGKDSLVTASGSDLHGDREFCQGEVEAISPARGLLQVWDSEGIEQLCEGNLGRAYSDPLLVSGGRPRHLSLNRINLSSSGNMSSPDSRIATDNFVFGKGRHFVWLRVVKVSLVDYKGLAFDGTTQSSLYCNNGFVVSNCRCAWIPANVGEDPKEKQGKFPWQQGQKDTEASIGRALETSVERDGGFDRSRWGGADLEPDEERPQSQVGNDYLAEFSKSLGNIKGGS